MYVIFSVLHNALVVMSCSNNSKEKSIMNHEIKKNLRRTSYATKKLSSTLFTEKPIYKNDFITKIME